MAGKGGDEAAFWRGQRRLTTAKAHYAALRDEAVLGRLDEARRRLENVPGLLALARRELGLPGAGVNRILAELGRGR